MNFDSIIDKAKPRAFYLTDGQNDILREYGIMLYGKNGGIAKALRHMVEVYSDNFNDIHHESSFPSRNRSHPSWKVSKRSARSRPVSFKDGDYEIVRDLSKKIYGNIGFNVSATASFLIHNIDLIIKIDEDNDTKKTR